MGAEGEKDLQALGTSPSPSSLNGADSGLQVGKEGR